MKLSISNIGWTESEDDTVYKIMQEYGFTGLEIAPTRVIADNPYEKSSIAREWAQKLYTNYEFIIPSMQSIWYGRTENIFKSKNERQILVNHTKKAINFAEMIGCKNLVFGCPRNRNVPKGADVVTAVPFFREIGDYAIRHGVIVAMEANPPIYHTNYVNDTWTALELIKEVDSEGFRLNLDIGTMIENEEGLDVLTGEIKNINHVHISEPGLKPITERKLHQDLKNKLLEGNYQGFISIEMGKTSKLDQLITAMRYVKEVFE